MIGWLLFACGCVRAQVGRVEVIKLESNSVYDAIVKICAAPPEYTPAVVAPEAVGAGPVGVEVGAALLRLEASAARLGGVRRRCLQQADFCTAQATTLKVGQMCQLGLQ